MTKRLLSLDLLRALAIVLMIYFHFAFDLGAFGFVQIDFTLDPFWWGLPRLIVFLFLVAVGGALGVASDLGLITTKSVFTRFLKLGILALIITIFTYFAFPPTWIYFGTLHCIALCSLAAWPIVLIKNIRLRILVNIIITLAIWIPVWSHHFIWPWIKLPHPSMDYIPFLPWFGVVTFGIALYDLRFFSFLDRILYKILRAKIIAPLLWMGRHSLAIYLIHQPVLYGIVWITFLLVK